MPAARIVSRKTKSGTRWDVKYRLGGRGASDLKKTFKTKAEAEAFRATLVLKVAGKPDSPEFGEAYEAFLKVKKSEGVAVGTMNGYAYTFSHLRDLDKVPLNALTTAAINAHYETLRKRGVGKSSLHKVRMLLNQVFENAIAQGDFEGSNPVPKAAKIKAPRPKKGAVMLPRETVDRLAEAIPEEHRIVFWTFVFLGIRRGELEALRVSDFSDDFETVHISRTKTNGYEGPTKTPRSNRVLTVPKKLRTMLKKHKPRDDGRMFTAGQVWGPRVLVPACEAIGIQPLTAHDLRDICAGLLIEDGLPVSAVSRQLGHANPTITWNRYVGSLDDSSDRAASKMDEMFGDES